MKQKLFTFFLALAASVGTMFAESGTCGKNLTWDLTDGVLTISGTGVMTDFEYQGTPWYSYRENITSVTIGNSVTSIGSNAFYDCYGLTSITIPNSVTSIGMSAFAWCSGLTSITIPNSVTSIGDWAFRDCSGLTSIEIPNSVTSIGESAFLYCSGLTSITIPNSVTSIGEGVFQECTGLTSVTIPNSLTSIGDWAFRDCSGLTSIEIPNSVTSIGESAFLYCSGLTSVTIGNSVTSIGGYAFSGCTGLTSIYNYATTPQVIDSFVFGGIEWHGSVNKSTCVLYVPAGSIDLYKAAEGWNEFENILPITAEDKEVNAVEVATSESTARIAWPQVSGAYTYELVIKDKAGNIVCTLVFNAQGQLLSIKFSAPAQNGAPQHSQAAGFAFTVTGLDPGTEYNYTLTSMDSNGAVLKTEKGTFRTEYREAVDEVSDGQSRGTKFLRDGQILIQKGDKIFDLRGREVK